MTEAQRKSWFESHLGKATLEAEQVLSARQPEHLENILERLLKRFVPNYTRVGNMEPQYWPESRSVFLVPSYLLPLGSGERICGLPKGDLIEKAGGRDCVRYFAHPADPESQVAPPGALPDPVKWYGTPTSSFRTLYVQRENPEGTEPLLVKLSLKRKTMGFPRLLTTEHAARGILISKMIQSYHENTDGLLPHGKPWFHFRETFACVPPGREDGGYVVRQIPPAPVPHTIWLPYFALLCEQPEGRWFDRLVQASGKTAEAFLWSELMEPLLNLYTGLALDMGIITELHQQNTGIAVDGDSLKVLGVSLRDMDGLTVDLPYREHLGLAAPAGIPKWAPGGVRVLRAKEAQLAQAFYVTFTSAMNFEVLTRGTLPDSVGFPLIQKANQHYLNSLHRRLGVKLRSVGQLARFWDHFHRRISPPELYREVKIRSRFWVWLYGWFHVLELRMAQYIFRPLKRKRLILAVLLGLAAASSATAKQNKWLSNLRQSPAKKVDPSAANAEGVYLLVTPLGFKSIPSTYADKIPTKEISKRPLQAIVEYYLQLCRKSDAHTCSVPNGLGICTSFLMGDTTTLWTAAHCFEDLARPFKGSVDFLLLDKNNQVVLDTKVSGKGYLEMPKSRFKELPLYSIDDVARLRLPCALGQKFLTLAEKLPYTDQPVFFYPDYLQTFTSTWLLSRPEVLRTRQAKQLQWNTEGKPAFQALEENTLFFRSRIIKQGMSGGPILDAKQNVVGLISCGTVEVKDLDVSPFPNSLRIREAMREMTPPPKISRPACLSP